MTITEFANHLGVSRQAVTKAVNSGRLRGAVEWVRMGDTLKAKFFDVDAAVRIWMATPGARAPNIERAALAEAAARRTDAGPGGPPPSEQPPGAPPSCADDHGASDDDEVNFGSLSAARLQFEQFRAKREKLKFEEESGAVINVSQVLAVFGKQIAEAKTSILAIGKLARSRIPHLNTDDVVTIEELCEQALEGLAVGEIAKETEDAEP